MCVFLDKNDEVLEKYNEIWNKVGKVIKKEFDSEPIYNDNYTLILQTVSVNLKLFLK